MITVRAVCPDCGEVTLSRHEIHLVISNVQSACRYSFTCPECLAWVSKPASPPAVRMLEANVVTRRETRPRELDEHRDGPAIGWDDLIDLSLGMRDTDLLAAFACR